MNAEFENTVSGSQTVYSLRSSERWFLNIEPITCDSLGRLYWMDEAPPVAHIELEATTAAEQRECAVQLRDRCLHLECIGVRPTAESLTLHWSDYIPVDTSWLATPGLRNIPTPFGSSPWCLSNSGNRYAPGVIAVELPSHEGLWGGFWLAPIVNRRIPPLFREGHRLREIGWYGGDCDSNIPLFFLADEIRTFCMENGLETMSQDQLKGHFETYSADYYRSHIDFWFMAESAVYFGREYSDAELARRHISREGLEAKVAALKARAQSSDKPKVRIRQ